VKADRGSAAGDRVGVCRSMKKCVKAHRRSAADDRVEVCRSMKKCVKAHKRSAADDRVEVCRSMKKCVKADRGSAAGDRVAVCRSIKNCMKAHRRSAAKATNWHLSRESFAALAQSHTKNTLVAHPFTNWHSYTRFMMWCCCLWRFRDTTIQMKRPDRLLLWRLKRQAV